MSKELYVGKISLEATEEELRKLFSVAGTVTSIHLITDPQSGEFKGCGYVRMATVEEARDAIITLDGARLRNRIITVSEARPQKPPKRTAAGTRPPGRQGSSRRGTK